MFEGIKSIFLNGKIKYKELQEVEKQIEFRSSIFEKEKKFIESSYLDALRDTDESNWTSLNVKDNRDLPDAARISLIDQADLMYYRNGHFRNIIKLFVKYTVGRGFQILPDCIDPIVKEFWDNIYDINRMKKRAKETVNRLHRHGEVFIRRFPQKDGTTLFRFMDPRLIRDPKEGANEHTTYGIETDPDDIENILYFYYDGEKIPAEEVIYEKIDVDSNVKRGRCKCEPIMEELAMYKGWMRDRMKLNKLRSMVGIVRKVTGSPTQVQNIANQNLKEDDLVTPKFTEETNFTKTVQEYYTEDLQIYRKSLKSISCKRNCLIDHPDLEEFFGISEESSKSSLSCGCTLF